MSFSLKTSRQPKWHTGEYKGLPGAHLVWPTLAKTTYVFSRCFEVLYESIFAIDLVWKLILIHLGLRVSKCHTTMIQAQGGWLPMHDPLYTTPVVKPCPHPTRYGQAAGYPQEGRLRLCPAGCQRQGHTVPPPPLCLQRGIVV